MKKYLLASITLTFFLGACSSDENIKEEENEKVSTDQQTTPIEQEPNEDPVVEQPVEPETPTINTSIFDLAKEVNVTDARDLTKHITVQIVLRDEVKATNGVNAVLQQTYDFLQQEDIKGAETVTIFVNSGNLKVFQFTVDTAKFVTNDEVSMAKLVLNASEVEKTTPEIEEFGRTFEFWD